MIKKCVKCGNTANEQAKFCSMCGSAEFMYLNEDYNNPQEQTNSGVQQAYEGQQVYGNQQIYAGQQAYNNQQGYEGQQVYGNQQMYAGQQAYNNQQEYNGQQAYNNQQGYSGQMYQPIQPQKKKSKKGVTAVIVIAAVLVVLMVIGAVAEKAYNSESGSASNHLGNSKEENFPYSKGSIVDGWYINDWANLKFEITDQWPEGDAALYESYEDEVTECGFISEDYGKQFVLYFEDVSQEILGVSEEDYLYVIGNQLKTIYEESSVTCTISEISDVTIANETYKATEINIENGLLYQYVCARKIEDYMVAITVTSIDKAEMDALISSMSAVR